MRVMTISITITILLSQQLLNILSQLLNNSDACYSNMQIIVTRVKLFRSQKEYLEKSICKKWKKWEVVGYIWCIYTCTQKYINACNMAQVYKYHTTVIKVPRPPGESRSLREEEPPIIGRFVEQATNGI